MRVEYLSRVRWLLLSAVGAGACGGAVDGTRDDRGRGGEAGAGALTNGPMNMGGASATGGKANIAGTGGSAGKPVAGSTAIGGEGPTGPAHGECLEPSPPNGGFVTCGNGLIHRAEKGECQNKLPTDPVTCGLEPNTYVCDGTKLETCGSNGGGTPPATSCNVGCATDEDCPAGNICVCGALVGACVAASCTVDSDCSDGYFCRRVTLEHDIGCGAQVSFQCQLPEDACADALECGTGGGFGQRCQPAAFGGPLRCEPVAGVACGRPYLVNGVPRSASLASDTDWAAALELDVSGMAAATRRALADGWNQLGLLEHASVAAFARFTLQLLGLGAPHALVLESNRAIADETRHAELCFGLAAAFAATAAGPGALDTRGALTRASRDEVVLDTFIEGCIGETVAALEAAEALERATLAAVRRVLQQIAEDEARHAALAWRFVAWGAARDAGLLSALGDRLELELARAERALAVAQQASPSSDVLASGGLLNDFTRAELRLHALREVVVPCLSELARTRRADESCPAIDWPLFE